MLRPVSGTEFCSDSGTRLLLLFFFELPEHKTPDAMPNVRPEFFEPCDVDGRKGWQWIESVKAYLDWRAGSSWRPMSHRFHPDREYYIHGIRLVIEARSGAYIGNAQRFPAEIRAELEKKPARSARLSAARKRAGAL